MMAGKGDRYRPVNGDKYRQNYDRIFRKNRIVKKELVIHDRARGHVTSEQADPGTSGEPKLGD